MTTKTTKKKTSKKKQVFKNIKSKQISKMEEAQKLFDAEINNKEPSRKRLIDKVKTQLKMTTAGASSYVSQICKKSEYEFPKTESKMDKAVVIYDKMSKGYWNGDIQRKDIIQKFITEIGLTKAGAATYFEMLKKREVEDEEN